MEKILELGRRRLADVVWLIPLLFVLAGIALAFGLIAIDRASGYKVVSTSVTGSASSVQQILTTTGTALVTLMSIVLSLTLVAVQLSMQQFSPRVVRSLFGDRRNLGARIILCDPHRAIVYGPGRLHGERVDSPDIRAGMAILIAALAAEGTSEIGNIIQIDRGYERIDLRLRDLGARIERVGVEPVPA